MKQEMKVQDVKLAICDGQICIDARQAYELLGEYDYRRYQLAKQIISLHGRGGWAVIKCSVGVLALFVGAVIWRMFVRDFVEEW